jgi:hypothetical protein
MRYVKRLIQTLKHFVFAVLKYSVTFAVYFNQIKSTMKKKTIMAMVCLLAAQVTYAQQQPAEDAALPGNPNLNERFLLLKSRSQDFKDYKVIKHTVLDGFWKIVRDSVAGKDQARRDSEKKIQGLKAELAQTQAALKKKEESMQEIVHDSTHITVLGIDFTKSVFLTTITVIVLALVGIVAVGVMRLKAMFRSQKDRADAFNELSNEYEDYKRKAMDKQTKLSRELQNERNRLSEMRGM